MLSTSLKSAEATNTAVASCLLAWARGVVTVSSSSSCFSWPISYSSKSDSDSSSASVALLSPIRQTVTMRSNRKTPFRPSSRFRRKGEEGAEEVLDALAKGDDGGRLDAVVEASVLGRVATIPGVPSAGHPSLVELLGVVELAAGLLPVVGRIGGGVGVEVRGRRGRGSSRWRHLTPAPRSTRPCRRSRRRPRGH